MTKSNISFMDRLKKNDKIKKFADHAKEYVKEEKIITVETNINL